MEERHIFHGGCHGCENTIDVCPGCLYFDIMAGGPNLNTRDIAEDKKLRENPEYAAAKDAEKIESSRRNAAYLAAWEAEQRYWRGKAIAARKSSGKI